MDLDELKIQLNKRLEGDQSFEMVVSNVSSLNNLKTNSVVSKIRKSLFTEIIFSVIFIAVFGYVSLFSKNSSIRIYFSFFLVVILVFTIFLLYLLKRTNFLESSAESIKSNLEKLHLLLSEFVKRYFQFTMLLIPICVFFSGYLGYLDIKHNINTAIFSNSINLKKFAILFSFIVVIFSVGMFFFTKWYLRKLYGNHLAEMKEMIEQLES
jgi:hypothetical protein